MKKTLKILLVIGGLLSIILTSLYLRISWLEISPHTVGFDEAALGYNAYSLLKTGKDEHGRGYSISLASFNDYKPALYAYLSMPFIKYMGLNQTSTRIVSGLAGTLTLLLIFIISYYFFSRNLMMAFFSLLIAAIQPWNLHYSRTAFESNLCTTFFTAGVLLILIHRLQGDVSRRRSAEGGVAQPRMKNPLASVLGEASINRGIKSELAAVFFFTLSMFSYHQARLAAPIFLLFYYLIKISSKKRFKFSLNKLIKLGIPLIILLIITLPIWLNLKEGLILTRLRQESALKRLYPYSPPELVNSQNIWLTFPAHPLYYLLANFVGHFFASFSPINLGLRVFHWVRSSPQNIATFSMIGWGECLFFLIGLFYLIKHWQKRNNMIFLAWIISGITPTIVTWNWFHPLRSLAIYPAITIICVLGMVIVLKLMPRPMRIIALTGFTILFLMQASYVINNELVYNVYESHGEYQPGGFKEGVPELAKIQEDYDKVIIETPHAQGYIFFLFYQSFPPEILQQFAKYRKLPGTEGDLSFNFYKYEFRKIYWPEDRKLKRTVFWGSTLSLPIDEVSKEPDVKIIKEFKSVPGYPAAVMVAKD